MNIMAQAIELVLEDLRCTPTGLNSLGSYANAVERHYGKQVIVDCRLVGWIDANIAAALAAIDAKAKEFGTLIEFKDLRPRIYDILERNGLFENRGIKPYRSCIPLRHYGLDEGKEFANFTSGEFAAQAMPLMSAALQQKFFEGLDELFNNASIHSKSEIGVYACGQSFPLKHALDFTIVDLGIGFKASVEKFLAAAISASKAIDWAMEENTTTRSGDIPGGLGLAILKSFVELNGGKLTVFSDNGYWNLNEDGIKMQELRSQFPGTFVNLEVNTADSNVYFLESELDPNAAL